MSFWFYVVPTITLKIKQKHRVGEGLVPWRHWARAMAAFNQCRNGGQLSVDPDFVLMPPKLLAFMKRFYFFQIRKKCIQTPN